MNKETAKQILTNSISNLQKRRGNITVSDLETEVINNACLYILKKQKDKTSQGKTIEEMFLGALESTKNFIPISKDFTEAAMELFPDNYTEKNAIMATMGIQQNIAWEGMWDFLRDYFQKNHGKRIDNTEVSQSVFNSTKHQRFENENLVSESEVERIINVSYIDNKEEVIVEIAPSLSPKKARIISKTANKLVYKGFDPDYLFTIELDSFDEIENFTLEMPNRKLKIQYFD